MSQEIRNLVQQRKTLVESIHANLGTLVTNYRDALAVTNELNKKIGAAGLRRPANFDSLQDWVKHEFDAHILERHAPGPHGISCLAQVDHDELLRQLDEMGA